MIDHARLIRDERGGAAVEFALVVPVLITFVFGIIQFGFLFSIYNTMVHAAREGARAMAVEQLTASEGRTRTEQALSAYQDLTFTVTTQTPDPSDPSDTDVRVAIGIPLDDAMLIDMLGLADGETVRARIAMRRE